MSVFLVILIIAVLWIVAVTLLSGPDLRQFDVDIGEHFEVHPEDTEATQRLLDQLQGVRKKAVDARSITKGLALVREFADNLSADLETDTQFTEVDIYGLAAEWAVAKGADSNRRVLFLHGGAFIFGSPKGHRKLAERLSKVANASVLSVDYRMLPENGRKAGITDAQHAYHWILNNGPDGKASADFLVVSGDSAGGNLALMLSSWSKRNASQRPDAVVVFSPSTDMTMVSPTLKSNRETDKMLGEGLGLIVKLPLPIRAWVALFSLRMNPANELASPVFGDLAKLPPTLIQASSNEMLLGESVRYTNRALAMGSDVRLQIWQEQIHVWHLFNMGYGSAETAWTEVETFIKGIKRKA